MRLRLNPFFVLIAALVAAPAFAQAAPDGSVKVSFLAAGRVTVIAQNATLGEILDEWSKAGGARLVASQLPSGRRTVALVDADESEALDSLLDGLPGFVATKRAEIVAGRSRYDSLKVLGVSIVGPNAPVDHANVPAPETVFEYASPSGVRFPAMPELPARDPAALDFGTLPEGVLPETVYDYALPSGERMLLPPGVDSVHESVTPPAEQPMPEMRFQYARPTPQLQDGSTAPALFWSAVADAEASAGAEQVESATPQTDAAIEPTGAAPARMTTSPEAAAKAAEPTVADPNGQAKTASEARAASAPAPTSTATTTGAPSKRPVTRRKPGGGR